VAWSSGLDWGSVELGVGGSNPGLGLDI